MKTMTGFDVSDPNFNGDKYVRQLRCVVRWMKNSHARGTIEAATAFGKTTVGMIAIAKMTKMATLKHNNTVLVVVPTTKLKQQWTKLLGKAGFNHVEVQVINTVALSEGFARKVDLLILDEVHLFAADKFQRVFERVNFSWVLGLTATVDRMDGKHDLINRHAPVCDTITQKEAIERGWISDFIEFNLAVPITREESEEQLKLGAVIRANMSKFGGFNKMLSCTQKANATLYAQQYNQEKQWFYANNPTAKKLPPITPGGVIGMAVAGMKAIRERTNFLDTTEHKIEATVELLNEFQLRTITFSQATAFAQKVGEKLGTKRAREYHTQIPSQTRMVRKEKSYKTMSGAQKYHDRLESEGFEPYIKARKNEYVVYWKVPKAFSGNKIADENMDLFERNMIDWLLSAKALDQGFDKEDVMLGIDGSRSENPTQHTQRTGRVARNFTLRNGKKAVKLYVNLYIPDWCVANSRDEQKLRACQVKNADSVVWVDSLDELKDMLKHILKGRTDELSST
jgi:superfamily II DNA or RNA helicase